ncbi:hypothetical protein LMJ53_03010 [Rheinheimera sp. UJ51]|nr:hypothetical protein [Rheinheimera sp. UJ51]
MGALQCSRDEKHCIFGRLHGLKTKYGIKAELGWKKLLFKRVYRMF